MKLTNCKLKGRYQNNDTGKKVNIHQGRNMQKGTDHYFYYLRGKRIFVSDRDFFHAYTICG